MPPTHSLKKKKKHVYETEGKPPTHPKKSPSHNQNSRVIIFPKLGKKNIINRDIKKVIISVRT